MKTKITYSILFLLAVLLFQPLSAAKWRVSNVPGVIADFTSLQLANDAASVIAGDTVYLEGSIISYSDVSVNKKLIIVGPGFFLGENDSTQANKVPATLLSLNMTTASEGSVVTGVSISGPLALNAGNIVIKRCYAYYNVGIYSSGNILIQSFLERITCYGTTQNNIIKNNYIYSPPYEACLYMNSASNAVIFNNIFSGYHRICNSEYRNNIAAGNQDYYNYYFEVTGSCTIENNIAAVGQYTSYPNNLNYQDMNTVFACWNDCTGFSNDDRYKLKSGSPAIAYGYGGVDCGMFGGSQPYVLSGIPSFPAIWELVVDGISVTVKAKSH